MGNPNDIFVFFFQYTDNLTTSFIKTAAESLRETCIHVADVGQNQTAKDAVKSVSCLNSCSGQGTCNNGRFKIY